MKPNPLPSNYELAPQSVHLWQLDTRLLATPWLESRLGILSREERERAERFKRGRAEFIASRLLVRAVLGAYLAQTPNSLVFARSDKGKPSLPGGELSFNLSHSGSLALLALGQTPNLGVDLEMADDQRDLMGIAEHFFAPAELRWLNNSTGSDQARNFYRLWTLKEATFKALGTGIATGLDKLCFTLVDDQIELQPAPELALDTSQWHFWQAEIGPACHCALALEAPQPPKLEWFDALALISQL